MTDFDELRQEIATQDSFKDLVSLIDDGKRHIQNAFDITASAARDTLKWCDSTTPLLKRLINKNDGSKAQAQQNLLTFGKSSRDNIREIYRRESDLSELVSDIRKALDRLAADFDRKTNEFKEANREFYKKLEKRFQNLKADISDLKSKLKVDTYSIDDLQICVDKTKGVLDLQVHPDLLESIIGECNRYHKIHSMFGFSCHFMLFRFQRQ